MAAAEHHHLIIFGGYARLPANVSPAPDMNVISIELEVDVQNKIIIAATLNFNAQLAEKMLQGLLIGHRLDHGIDGVIQAIRARYHSSIQRALVACVEDAYRQYQQYDQESGRQTARSSN